MKDEAVARELETLFVSELQQSRELSVEEICQMPLAQRIKNGLARLASPLL